MSFSCLWLDAYWRMLGFDVGSMLQPTAPVVWARWGAGGWVTHRRPVMVEVSPKASLRPPLLSPVLTFHLFLIYSSPHTLISAYWIQLRPGASIPKPTPWSARLNGWTSASQLLGPQHIHSFQDHLPMRKFVSFLNIWALQIHSIPSISLSYAGNDHCKASYGFTKYTPGIISISTYHWLQLSPSHLTQAHWSFPPQWLLGDRDI